MAACATATSISPCWLRTGSLKPMLPVLSKTCITGSSSSPYTIGPTDGRALSFSRSSSASTLPRSRGTTGLSASSTEPICFADLPQASCIPRSVSRATSHRPQRGRNSSRPPASSPIASSGRYGTVFAAFPDGHNTLYDFALQLWSRGGELTDSTGRPLLTTPVAIAALEFYRRVVRDPALCHPQSPQLDSTQSGDLFLAGEVAMMANWFGFAARSGREGSPLAGKVAIAPIPTANSAAPVSLSVFWALAMGKGSRQKELAWQFLRFVASAERDLGITRHGAVGVRLSTWRNPELQARIPVYRGVESISLGARQLPYGPAHGCLRRNH